MTSINFTVLTDLINAVMDVLDVIIAHTDTLVGIAVIGIVLALVGYIGYKFLPGLLEKIMGHTRM